MDSSSCSGKLLGRCEIVGLVARYGPLGRSFWLFLSKVGYFRTSHVSWVLRKLSDVEEGCSEVEDDHESPCGEAGYQGHELFGLDGASIRGCKDLRGSTSATRRCGVNLEGCGCHGWLNPGGRVQTPLAKGTVQRGKEVRTRSLRQYTTRRLAQIEAASTAALVTMPTTTWGTVLKVNGSTELDDVARALNMLDVESQEGIIKAPVKLVVHLWKLEHSLRLSFVKKRQTKQTTSQMRKKKNFVFPWKKTMAARLLHCHE